MDPPAEWMHETGCIIRLMDETVEMATRGIHASRASCAFDLIKMAKDFWRIVACTQLRLALRKVKKTAAWQNQDAASL